MKDNFRDSICKCIQLAFEIGYLFQAGSTVSLNASSDFKSKSRKAISYREVYEAGTLNQDFNLMLSDMSYFQFTEIEKDKEIRLAYYPNPFQFVEYKSERENALELLEKNEFTLDEYEQFISECNYTHDIPLIRYDLSIEQHCDKYHPAGHLHIGFVVENRWPVAKILSPYAFLLNILMQYYSKLWIQFGDEGDKRPNRLDIMYREELKRCNVISDEFFTESEKERLVFS